MTEVPLYVASLQHMKNGETTGNCEAEVETRRFN